MRVFETKVTFISIYDYCSACSASVVHVMSILAVPGANKTQSFVNVPWEQEPTRGFCVIIIES